MRYDIIQQYNKSDLKLQAKINRQVGSSYSSTDQFEKAVYHFDLSLDFIEKALSNNSSYSNKKDLYIDKEIALLGKLNNEQSIKQNLAEYKKVYSILSSMNNELKLLDKTTAQYTVLDIYYNLITDYNKRKINLNNAKDLVEKQIEEAEKLNDWRLNFFITDKRNLMFDEAWNDIDLENFDNAIKIANDLKNYETTDTGIVEVRKKVFLKNLFGQIYSGQRKHKKAIDSYLIALDILNKSFEKDFELKILS